MNKKIISATAADSRIEPTRSAEKPTCVIPGRWVLLLAACLGCFSGTLAASPFSGGAGTPEDPWIVASLAQLQRVRDHMDGHFALGADIDAAAAADWNHVEGLFAGRAHLQSFWVGQIKIRPATLEVSVDGVVRPEAPASGWQFDPDSRRVRFYDAEGAEVTPETLYGVERTAPVRLSYEVDPQWGTGLEQWIGNAGSYEYSIPLKPIQPGSVRIWVAGEERAAGTTSGWQVDHATGMVSFYDADGQPTTASALYGVQEWNEVTARWDVEGGGWPMGFQPIGTDSSWGDVFEGSFDGRGFRVLNLVQRHPRRAYAGLFGGVGEGGIVRDLGIDAASFDVAHLAGWGYVGLLAGSNAGLIEGCHSAGTVRSGVSAGGLVGSNAGTIRRSFSTAEVHGVGRDPYGMHGMGGGEIGPMYSEHGANVGGLIGALQEGVVERCFASGEVRSEATAGGLIGSGNGIVRDAYARGNVSGKMAVGGLIGEWWNGEVSRSYAANQLSGDWGDPLGLIGSGGQSGDHDSSFYDRDLAPPPALDDLDEAGVGKTTAEMKTVATYTDLSTETERTGVVLGEGGSIWMGQPDYQWVQQKTFRAVGYLLKPDSVTVFLDGVIVDPSEYTIDYETSSITFAEAPADGVVVRADFTSLGSYGLTQAWDLVGNPLDDTGDEDIWDLQPGVNDGYPYLVGVLAGFSLQVLADPPAGGQVYGGGVYPPDTQVTVRAVGNPGYTFLGWFEGDLRVSEEAEWTFVLLENRVLVARFDRGDADHDILVIADPAQGGEVSGTGAYYEGDPVTVVAVPAFGWRLVNWTEGGVEVSTDESYVFSATASRELTANFELKTYAVSLSHGAGGSVTPVGAVLVSHGHRLDVQIVAEEGYRIADVLADGTSVGTPAVYSFQNVQEPRTLEATFVRSTRIDASAGAGGSIDPAGSRWVDEGNDQTYTIAPLPGYRVLDVVVDGVSRGPLESYAFESVHHVNHRIEATFLRVFEVTVEAGAGGSATPSGVVAADAGSDLELVFTPDEDFVVQSVRVDGRFQGARQQIILRDVRRDMQVEVAFIRAHRITAEAGAGGEVIPAGEQIVTEGARPEFQFTPDQGYRVLDVLLDGGSVGAPTQYLLQPVTQDHLLMATFQRFHTIEASARFGGTISPRGLVSVDTGSDQTFTIEPNPDFIITDVLVNGESELAEETFGPFEYTFANVQADDHAIEARFRRVGSDIAIDTTWTLENSPYTIDRDVTVEAGATLTVEPGVEVLFEQHRGLSVEGTLVAQGTEALPIRWTGTTATPGWWGAIFVRGEGQATLDWNVIEYGGGLARMRDAALVRDGTGALALRNSRLLSSAADGLVLRGTGLFESVANRFAHNQRHGLRFDGESSLQDSTSVFEGNGAASVWFDGQTIGGEMAWQLPPTVAIWIPQDLWVHADARLQIEEGTVLKFGARGGLFVYGSLVIQGSMAKPVVLTEHRDDTAGGDSNLDGDDSAPEPSGWGGVNVRPGGRATIAHADLRYAGARRGRWVAGVGWVASRGAALGAVSGAGAIELRDSQVRFSGDTGLQIADSTSLRLENNAFSDNVRSGSFGANVSLVHRSSTYADSLAVSGNVTEQGVVWDLDADTVLMLPRNFNIAEGGSLEITGGARLIAPSMQVQRDGTLRLDAGTTIDVQQRGSLTIRGELEALGSSAHPVRIRGVEQEPGYWRQLLVANTGQVRLEYTELSDGGDWGPMLQVSAGGQLVLRDARFSRSGAAGLELQKGALVDSERSRFENNQEGLSLHASVSWTDPAMTMAGNSGTDLRISGSVEGDVAWRFPPAVAASIGGQIGVPAGSSLTIHAGSTLKFIASSWWNPGGLDVDGTLTVLGEAERPVVFTDLRDDSAGGDTNRDGEDSTPAPGAWGGVRVGEVGTLAMRHAQVRYGGHSRFGGASVLKQGSGAIDLRDVVVRQSSNIGLLLAGHTGTTLLDAVTFEANRVGLEVDGLTSPVRLRNAAFQGNSAFAVNNPGDPRVDARWCWWGDESGPYHPTLASDGQGDRVSDGVLFDPWRRAVLEVVSPAGSGTVVVGDTLWLEAVAAGGFHAGLEWRLGDDWTLSGMVPGLTQFSEVGRFPITLAADGYAEPFAGPVIEVVAEDDAQPDLSVETFLPDGLIVSPGRVVRVPYQVLNVGPGAISGGRWTDALYLAEPGGHPGDALLLAVNEVVGDVAAGSLYDETFEFVVPQDVLLFEDGFDVILSVDDRWDLLDRRRANNLAAADGVVEIPWLADGEPVEVETPDGDFVHYFRMETQAGLNPVVEVLADEGGPGNWDLAASEEGLPRGLGAVNAESVLLVPSPADGLWFLRVQGTGGGLYTIRRADVPLLATAATPERHWSGTDVLFHMQGAGFMDGLTVALRPVGGGETVAATRVTVTSYTRATVRYAQGLLEEDFYDIHLSNGSGDAAVLPAAIHVSDRLETTIDRAVTLRDDTIWHGDVWVNGSVTVDAGATLTLLPGTVLRFAPNTGLRINRGRLEALGRADALIRMTSERDGVDGQTPAPGDWDGMGINYNGSVLMEHFEVRYARTAFNVIPQMRVTNANIDLVLRNGYIHDNSRYGIFNYQPYVETFGENLVIARNGLTGIFIRADSRHVYRNCTIVGNGFGGSGWNGAGIHHGASNLTFDNCIIAFNNTGIHHQGQIPEVTLRNNLFYQPGRTNYAGARDRDILDKYNNRIGDPLFVDFDAGNYELGEGSAAIDAGRGQSAPPRDLLGRARFDDLGMPNEGVGAPNYADIGAFERQEHTRSGDLAVVDVSIPEPRFVSAGDSVVTSWTVANLGTEVSAGTWDDTVYVSSLPHVNPEMQAVASRTTTQTLQPGQRYDGGVAWEAPTQQGVYYAMVRADVEDVLAEPARRNNDLFAPHVVAVDLPVLPVGGSVSSLGGVTWTYVRMDAEPGRTIRVQFDGMSRSGTGLLVARHGLPPTGTEYDVAASGALNAPIELRIHNPRSGPYFIGLLVPRIRYGRVRHDFTMRAELTELDVRDVLPGRVGNAGRATVQVLGDRFEPGSEVRLRSGAGLDLAAESVFFEDDSTLYATFDLAGAAVVPGDYAVAVVLPTLEQAERASALSVVDGGAGELHVALTPPTQARPGRVIPLTVTYENRGLVDVPSPLLTLTCDQPDVLWEVPGEARWVEGPFLEVLGLSSSGPAAILRPGQRETLVVKARTPFRLATLDFNIYSVGAIAGDGGELPVVWNLAERQARPAGMSEDVWWDLVRAMEDRGATTRADFAELLRTLATRLQAQSGSVELSVQTLLGYLSDELLGTGVTWVRGRLIDDERDEPVPHAKLLLRLGDDPETQAFRILYTDDEGRFRADNLPAGRVGFFAEDYRFDPTPEYDFEPYRLYAEMELRGQAVPRQFEDETDELLPSESDPSLTVAPDGTAYLAWSRGPQVWVGVAGSEGWLAGPVPEAAGVAPRIRYSEHLIDGTGPGLLLVWRVEEEDDEGVMRSNLAYAIAAPPTEAGALPTWSEARVLSEDAVDEGSPDMVVTAEGDAVFVWRKVDGTNVEDDYDLYYDVLRFAAEDLPPLPLGVEQTEEPGDGLVFEPLKATTNIAFEMDLGKFTISSIPLLRGEWGLKSNAIIEASKDLGSPYKATAAGQMNWDFSLGDNRNAAGMGSSTLNWQGVCNRDAGGPEYVLTDGTLGFAISANVDIPLAPFEFGVASGALGAKVTGGASGNLTFSPGSFSPHSGSAAMNVGLGPYGKAEVGIRRWKIEIRVEGIGTMNAEYDILKGTWQIFPTLTLTGEGKAGPFKASISRQWGGASGMAALSLEPTEDNPFGPYLTITLDTKTGTLAVYEGRMVVPPTTPGESPSLSDHGQPALALGADGAPLLAWTRDSETPDTWLGSEVLVATYDAALETWSAPEVLAGSRGFNSDVALALDPLDRPMLVWSTADSAGVGLSNSIDDILDAMDASSLVYSLRGAGGWSAPTPFATLTAMDQQPVLGQGADDTVVVAWTAGENGDKLLRSMAWDGTSWTGPNLLTTGAVFGLPTVGTVGGESAVYWTVSSDGENGEAPLAIWHSALSAGGVWTAPQSFTYATVPEPVGPESTNWFKSVWDWLSKPPADVCQGIRVSGDLDFGDVEIGKDELRKLTIQNLSEAPVDIAMMSYPEGFIAFTVGSTLAGNATVQTHVQFKPTEEKSYSGVITVPYGTDGRSETIAVSGVGIAEPDGIQVTGNLSFGGVLINTSEASEMTIRNLGSTPLTVSGVTAPDGFSASFSGVIEPKGSAGVTVTFSPTAEQNYGGAIVVASDATVGDGSIGCSGRGVKDDECEEGEDCDPPPPPPPPAPKGGGKTGTRTSITPEDKFGPAGYDAPGTAVGFERRFIQPGGLLDYRIEFWNKEDAEVPTQDADIVDDLDPAVFDFDTFEFTRIGFLDWDRFLTGSPRSLDEWIEAPEMGIKVRVRADFDDTTGRIYWWFQCLDIETGDYPTDPEVGFLPPFNPETQYELGWVEYRVRAKDDLDSGTVIRNQARVRFDFLPFGDPPLPEDRWNDGAWPQGWGPAPKEGPWVNTIDAVAPTSAVLPLPAESPSLFFTVAWAGEDDPLGSGVAEYDVFVSENDGGWTTWQSATAATEAEFEGVEGSTYAFVAFATDNVDNREEKTPLAEATTTVHQQPAPAPTFDPDGGRHWGTTVEVVVGALEDAEVRYTLDGTVPTLDSDLVGPEGRVVVPIPAVLTARAWVRGMLPGEAHGAEYLPAGMWPSGGVLLDERRPEFTWPAVAGATWYNLYVMGNGQAVGQPWVEGAATWTPTGDLRGGNYTWWVRSWGPDIGMQPWSGAAEFGIRVAPPIAPVPVPVADPPLGQRRPTLHWDSDGPEVAWFQVHLNRNGGTHLSQWVERTTQWTPPSDLPAGDYDWWVRGWNADGFSPWSTPASSFTIAAMQPEAIEQLGPTGMQPANDVVFEWRRDERATWYRLWARRPGGGTWHDRWYDGAGSGVATAPVAGHPGGESDWWIVGWGPDGYGPWAGPMVFETPDTAPAVPTLTAPVGATTSPVTLEYASERAEWFRVYVQRGGTRVFDGWTDSPTHELGELPPGDYAWWVAAWNEISGRTIWSDRGEFVIP